MRLEFRSEGFTPTEELRSTIERRLRFVLGRFAGRIGQVAVNLATLDSMRVNCRIVVSLTRNGKIEVEDMDKDIAALVKRSVDRIGASVRRELDRRREHSESHGNFVKKRSKSGSWTPGTD
jgi:ribosome-associated translation inhibitor RaiA